MFEQTYTHHRAEDLRENHEIDQDLQKIEHERGDLPDTKQFFLNQGCSDRKDNCHRPKNKQVREELEEAIPECLKLSIVVDFNVANVVSRDLLSFSCESLHCPDIRECFLRDCGYYCLGILDILLDVFHGTTEEHREDYYRQNAANNDQGELP